MKKIMLLILLGILNTTFAAFQLPTPEYKHARRYGAKAKVIFNIVDEEGKPVEGADVSANFYMQMHKKNRVKGKTDKNGIFVAAKKCRGEVNFIIKKDGYYRTHDTIKVYGTRDNRAEVKDGKWMPYGKTHKVVLKKIKNPIPVISYKILIKQKPRDIPLGFDLQKGDFLPPYGCGEVSDFYMTFEQEEATEESLERFKYTFSFPNKYDGYIIRDIHNYSEFRSDYNAPTDDVYQQEYFSVIGLDNKRSDVVIDIENKYMILRTRSKTNENGELVEAYYSKIFFTGDGNLTYVSFNVYANPDLNSTNLEFNLKENRFSPLPDVKTDEIEKQYWKW
jgi:hypothetical protein